MSSDLLVLYKYVIFCYECEEGKQKKQNVWIVMGLFVWMHC